MWWIYNIFICWILEFKYTFMEGFDQGMSWSNEKITKKNDIRTALIEDQTLGGGGGDKVGWLCWCKGLCRQCKLQRHCDGSPTSDRIICPNCLFHVLELWDTHLRRTYLVYCFLSFRVILPHKNRERKSWNKLK